MVLSNLEDWPPVRRPGSRPRIYTETGVLRGGRSGMTLLRDDGGRWQLEVSPPMYRMDGRRVRITAERIGFDLLSVSTFEPLD